MGRKDTSSLHIFLSLAARKSLLGKTRCCGVKWSLQGLSLSIKNHARGNAAREWTFASYTRTARMNERAPHLPHAGGDYAKMGETTANTLGNSFSPILWAAYLVQNPTMRTMCQKSSKSSSAVGFRWYHSSNMWYGKKQIKKTARRN